MVRRLVALLVVSGVLGGLLIGTSMGGVAAARRTTVVKATSPHTTLVTLADNGHSYRFHKGYMLDIQLTEPSSYITWNEPVSSNQSVLEPTGGSSGTTATATFVAGAKGKAEVTATGTIVCSSVCAGPAVPAFKVNVSIIG